MIKRAQNGNVTPKTIIIQTSMFVNNNSSIGSISLREANTNVDQLKWKRRKWKTERKKKKTATRRLFLISTMVVRLRWELILITNNNNFCWIYRQSLVIQKWSEHDGYGVWCVVSCLMNYFVFLNNSFFILLCIRVFFLFCFRISLKFKYHLSLVIKSCFLHHISS